MTSKVFWSGKRVFVTGHTGFKGTWLILWLEALGARIAGYALAPPTDPSLWALVERSVQVRSRIADVRDLATLGRAMREFEPDIVFHLAAQSLVRASYVDPVGTYATNVLGTVHLLEAARQLPSVRAIVNVTSDKCYQNLETGQAYRESDPMGGHDPYSSSKGCAELVTTAYRDSFFARKGGAALASARAGNVIGGGDWALDRVVPDTVRAALAGVPVRIRNPNAVRPWQHVLEPLCGYLQLAERLWAEPRRFAEGWNFGPDDTDAVPVKVVVSTLVRHWGPPAAWTADSGEQLPEANFLRLDSSKARRELGWRPRLGLERALEWTVRWYTQHARGADARSLAVEQIGRYMELANA